MAESSKGLEIIHLRTGGISLVIQIRDGGIPALAHWGEDLDDLSPEALLSLCTAQDPPIREADGAMQPGLIPLASDGWMGRPGLAGHRPGGTGWSPRLRTISADVDAENLVRSASESSHETGATITMAGAGLVTCCLRDEETALAVGLFIELLPQGLIRIRTECTNIGSDLYELEELSVALPVPLDADEILDFSGRWSLERAPQRTPVRMGAHVREGRRGRTGLDAPMMMYCGSRGFDFDRGRIRGVHVAHSGNHRTWVERIPIGRQVMGGGELLLPGEILLEPGETYIAPWVYALYADGLDNAARMLHRWERSLETHPGTCRPVTLNVWEAVYFNHDLDVLRRQADRAARIGVERFVLDDGWFLGRRDEHSSLGDWTVDPEVWPEGLRPLVDHVRGLGMQFGLWFEPEMVSVDSELARAHPEWILKSRTELPVENRFQQVLNITIPEAWEHVRSQMDALIREYDIDYLKWDHNRDLIDAGDALNGGRASVHEQTLACYRLMDRLRADHPGLEIESCSSGGGRVDLEMVRHVQRFWISDCMDPHERQSIMRWSEQLLAPELMGTHVASARSHTTGRISDLSFRAGTALWGHMGFEMDLLSVDEDELATLAEWVSFYKENREMLLTGDLIRRDVGDGSLWLHGIISPERDRAMYQLTSRSRSPMTPRGLMPLPGLDGGRSYRVRPVIFGSGPEGLILPPWGEPESEGIVMDGSALAIIGVHTPMIYPDQVSIIRVDEVETRSVAEHPQYASVEGA